LGIEQGRHAGVERGENEQGGDGRPLPANDCDGNGEGHAREQNENGHSQAQPQGVQDPLAFLLHFEEEQLEAVLADDEGLLGEALGGVAEMRDAVEGWFHVALARVFLLVTPGQIEPKQAAETERNANGVVGMLADNFVGLAGLGDGALAHIGEHLTAIFYGGGEAVTRGGDFLAGHMGGGRQKFVGVFQEMFGVNGGGLVCFHNDDLVLICVLW
jgi:hypothetical protein